MPRLRGGRLRPESLAVRVGGRPINQVCALTIKEAGAFFEGLALGEREQAIARRVLKEIRERLGFLQNVGLEYLTLERAAGTLSGGEGQRIRLATQIGSSLVGVLYILDEPSIGLHQRDNRRLLDTLLRLRDLGNTVLVVEHDEETIQAADHVIDLGPGAGELGGYVVSTGTPEEIMADPKSLTGRYLSGELSIPVPATRRPGTGKTLTVHGARRAQPQGHRRCASRWGRSPASRACPAPGSARSSTTSSTGPWLRSSTGRRSGLARTTASKGCEHLDKVIDIDQSPIGRTPRSNPATYTGVFTFIRDAVRAHPRRAGARLRAGALLASTSRAAGARRARATGW